MFFIMLSINRIKSKVNCLLYMLYIRLRLIVFNVLFNNISVISWRSVLLVEEVGVPEENHRPVASHWQTWSHNLVSNIPHNASSDLTLIECVGTTIRSWPRRPKHILTYVICIISCNIQICKILISTLLK
jgi:hypothetical protein